jgi:hypothetical protein
VKVVMRQLARAVWSAGFCDYLDAIKEEFLDEENSLTTS